MMAKIRWNDYVYVIRQMRSVAFYFHSSLQVAMWEEFWRRKKDAQSKSEKKSKSTWNERKKKKRKNNI